MLFKRFIKSLTILAFLAIPAKADGPAFWLVEDDDTKIYVLGTVHILPDGINWQTDALMKAFEASSSLTLENHPDSVEPAALQPIIMRYAFNAGGATLKDSVSAETYQALVDHLGSEAMAQSMAPMKPWFVGMMLAVQEMQKAGHDPSKGVESVLTELAKAQGKGFGGLESPEAGLKVFDGMTKEDNDLFLLDTLRQMKEFSSEMDEMLIAWKTGDTEGLNNVLNAGFKDAPKEFVEKLLIGRNKSWVAPMKELLTKPGTHMVAVGAGHLVGKDNLLELMAAEGGVKITRQQ